MSKGDNRRPSSVPKEEFDRNFEAIFGPKKLNIWEDQEEDEEDRLKSIEEAEHDRGNYEY